MVDTQRLEERRTGGTTGPNAAAAEPHQKPERLAQPNRGMARLVLAVQELSLARNLEGIMVVVRRAARELTGADGATFVLKEDGQCYYADEDAVAPLWKGQRFPISACISGWTMLNRKSAIIEDIYADSRIPAEAYRATFVKSLLMVPIRTEAPIGAIGNYWATRHLPGAEEVELLEALASTTAVAMQNVQMYNELEERLRERTAQLETANRELQAFSSAVSHDLGAPLRAIRTYVGILEEKCAASLPAESQGYVGKISAAANRMRALMDDLLRLSRISLGGLMSARINLSKLAGEILSRLAAEAPERKVETHVAPGLEAEADPGLVRIALENLLSNAWKYTSKCAQPRIEFACDGAVNGACTFFVRDNGAGFDMRHARDLFQPFRRLHNPAEFTGSGIGLATVQRIIQRHGGRIWAEAAEGEGATFYFTLPGKQSAPDPAEEPLRSL